MNSFPAKTDFFSCLGKKFPNEIDDKLKVNRRIYKILQFLGISILDKTHVRETLTNCDYQIVKETDYK
jgi:hypothetical protein